MPRKGPAIKRPLVTDPAQTGQVTDNNNSAPAESDREDVFVWDSRLPAPSRKPTDLQTCARRPPGCAIWSWERSRTSAALRCS